ncbi:MAG TPA: dCTP deaminase [Candidatus Saccharimonadales bacterium]|nr:dCTP deaminase [Candidatus Saccharimonadales bacterium]
MILTGPEIASEVKSGRIQISPFDPRHINPNSYNFHIGQTIKVYEPAVLDAKRSNATRTIKISPEGMVLEPNRLYLGHIEERIGSNNYVPIMKGRSSIGRLGLFINITADLIDQGAFGQWTLQMHAVQPVKIYPGMSIGQMTFWVPIGQPQLYTGKYQNARGPMASLSHKNFQSGDW